MFAQIEGTARYPIDTSRSLDTRGVATAKPQLFRPYSTTLCVVLFPWAAFRWRGRTDDVTQPGPGARHFSYAGTLRKKKRSEQERYPRQKGQRQAPPVDRLPSPNRDTLSQPHRDKTHPRPGGHPSQVENFEAQSGPLIPWKKIQNSVTSLILKLGSHNTSYQPHIRAATPLVKDGKRRRKYAART